MKLIPFRVTLQTRYNLLSTAAMPLGFLGLVVGATTYGDWVLGLAIIWLILVGRLVWNSRCPKCWKRLGWGRANALIVVLPRWQIWIGSTCNRCHFRLDSLEDQ